MRKRKVLHIITRLDKGGSAENTLLTCIGLNKQIYQVWLATGAVFSPRVEWKKEAEDAGVRFVIIPQLVRSISPLRDVVAFCKIFQLIKRERFDIVHTHTSKAGILGRWAARLAGTRLVIHTPHGHIFYGYFNRVLTTIFVFIERITALITDKIITLAEKGKREHLKLKIASPDKFVTIHSGVRLSNIIECKTDVSFKTKMLNLPDQSRVVGTVGRLVKVKGHRYLLESAKHVLKVLPETVFLLVGDGPLREELEILARNLKISNNVRFLGWQDNIVPILKIMDLFVLSALNEGMGRVLVEAQACGLPVVATDVGGVAEVIVPGRTGILVPPRDSAALAEAIIKLLTNPDILTPISQNVREQILSEFSAERMVEKIEQLYGTLYGKLNIEE